ncbi:MAG: demethoxyubiquinone hydroxylase family protein [Holosporales bacterium]
MPNRSYERFPGDRSKQEVLASMLRVDHAGEYGAVRIYQGQLDALRGQPDTQQEVQHMLAQEQVHLTTFDALLAARGVSPTKLQPLWHHAAYAMGWLTARLGAEAAMACTVAVEEVIDRHYQEQMDTLADLPEESELKATIAKFREEELEHRDLGLQQGAQQAPLYPVLKAAVGAATRLAIFLSKRV